MSKWLPNPQLGDPDNLQLHAVNKKGLPLSMTKECNSVTHQGGALTLDQMECISGGHQSFYVDVKEDNTTLFISTTGGTGNADIFYNANTWASPENAQRWAIKTDNEEVIVVNANRGFHFISVGSQTSYDLAGLTVSIGKAPQIDPTIPGVADACAIWLPPTSGGGLRAGYSQCVAQGMGYFTTYIDATIASITVSTAHGSGDLSLYTGANWPNAHSYEWASKTANSNSETITIDNPTVGWLYITVDGRNAQGMSVRMDKTAR
jgi:microbial collagenase